tara:strand:- start:398 stop:625 length:228 start_codon:yes stop_codon:yes gene_type:complete
VTVFVGSKATPKRTRFGPTGMTFQEIGGSKAMYQFNGDELYVRAVIHCDAPPYFKYDEFSDMEQKAWTQPIGWRH